MTKVLGKYKILDELGRGGMGIVYHAYDTHLQRNCALKVLLPEAANNTLAIKRFKSEALAVAKINHPNIIQIYEVHQQKPYFFVMNYVAGTPLDKYAKNLDLSQKLQLFSKICEAVAFAHKQNILHRDLKPSNILVTTNGEPVIVDFGIAKNIEDTTGLTKTGHLIGTPKYMSPEVAHGDVVNERSDVYSLGVILYQLLTGNVPFLGDNIFELLFLLTTQDPIAPSRINSKIARDSDIEIICLKALEKKPQQRIATAKIFHREIENIIHNRPVSFKPPSLWYKVYKLYHKNYLTASILLTALIFSILTPLYLYVITNAYAKDLEENLKAMHIDSKLNLIQGSLEEIYNQRRSLNVVKAYRNIEKRYKLLTEIMEVIPQQKTQQIYRQINNHLKFLILPNFPQITQQNIPDQLAKRTRPSLSPDGQFLAKLYYDKSFYIVIWKKTSQNSLQKIAQLPCADEKIQTALFSPDNRFVVYRNPQHFLSIYDLQKQQHIFHRKDGLSIHAQFAQNSRYLIFPIFERKYQWYIFDTQKQKLQKLLVTDKPEKALLSPNSQFLVIGTMDDILIYDLQKRHLHAKKPTVSRWSYQMAISRNSENLFILALTNIFVINLRNPKNVLKRPTKYISQKSMPPLAAGNSRFLFSDERGNLSILYTEQENLNITTQVQYNDGKIDAGDFAPENFVVLSKGSLVQIQNLDVTDLIATLQMPEKIEHAQIALDDDGLHITIAMQTLLRKYIFPFSKLKIQDPILRSLIKIEKQGRSSVDLLKRLIVNDNIVIHSNDFAFAVWYDQKFFFQKFWEESTQILFHQKTKQLHVFFKKIAKIYNYQNGEILGQYEIHLPKEEEVNRILFSRNGKSLYMTSFNKNTQQYRLVKQNIYDTFVTEIGRIKYQGSAIHELQQNHILVGLEENLRNNGEFCILSPNTKTVYMSEINEEVHHGQISALTVSNDQSFLVVGDINGKITIWKNATKPRLIHALQTPAGIEKITIDPNDNYCSLFTKNNIYICDLHAPSRLFTIYSGHHKFGKSTFNHDWTKAYLPDASHEILVFNQAYFVDDDALIKKLDYCDQILPQKTNLAKYMETVKKHLQKHKKITKQESLMSDNWFVKSNKSGKIFGPHPQDLIRRYLKEGKINHREYTISSDGNTWQSLSSFWRQKGPAAEIMGKYEILEELGRGGMGIVYKAFDSQLKRHCAIKVLIPIGNIDKKRAIERFKTEAMAIAKITHPNIVQVYEVHDQHPYFFVMSYIEGLPLDKYIEDLDIPQRLQMFSKICTPIIFAHQNNILHRDLKPDNIIVTVSGEPIIVDFGIAKNTKHKTNVTQTGDIVGTPRYISPEAVNGQEVDERSDVYSLGVILYEMLTDRVPFVGGSPVEIMVRLTSEEPVAPSLLNTSVKKNGDLELICLAALEKKPQKRIPSACYLKSEIDNILNGHPIKLKPPTILQKFTKWRKSSPLVFTTVTAMFIIVCAALFAMKLEREHSFHLQKQTQQHILQLQKKSMQEITETKISSIDSTIEALSTNITANNIFVDYYAIKRCYRYLSEIVDNLPPERAKKIYQTLNMYLKFHILCKFPHVFETTLPLGNHVPVFSSHFIAKLYDEKKSQTLYIWQNNQQQKLSKDNYYVKMPNLYNENLLKFSPNNKYLAYQDHGHTNLYDLQTKKIIFSQVGFTGRSIFSPQSNYYIFVRQQENMKICHLVNLSNFQIRNFQTYEVKDIVISPNEEWLVIHDKTQRKFIIYNFKKDQTFEFKNDMLSNDNRICFTKNENKIFVVSRVNVTILNLSQLTDETTSPSLLLSTRLSAPPIRINDYYFTIATKDGSIVLAKQNIDDDSVFQEKLANYSNVGISHLAFQAPSFLTIARNNTLELRDLSTKKLISILREKTAVKQLQVKEKNGLQISLVTQQKYKEYTFPYKTLQIKDKGVKELITTFMSMIRDIDPAHSLIVDEDTCIYTGRVGFGVWRKERFFDKRFYEEINSVKYSKNRKQLFLCSHQKMQVFSGKDATWVSNHNIPRTFFKRGISSFDFSHDEQHLYIACCKPYELFQQDIRTKEQQAIIKTQNPIRCILSLKGDIILLGCTAFGANRSTIHIVNRKAKTQRQILKDIPLFGITSFATDKAQQLFAAGGQNGNILLWKGLSSPVLYDKLKIDNEVTKLMFSPENRYLAIFSLNRTYIYSLDLKTKLEIYSGYYKGKSATFSDDWQKMFLPSPVGEVMVFNQDYLVNETALHKRIIQCDETMSAADNTSTLMHYINNIRQKIKQKTTVEVSTLKSTNELKIILFKLQQKIHLTCENEKIAHNGENKQATPQTGMIKSITT